MSGSPASVRITFLGHAATAATRAGRFPEPDDPLDARATAQLGRVTFRPGGRHRCWTSPARRAVATAAALGFAATPEPLLDDAAAGAWAGRSIEDLSAAEPEGLADWFGDPGFAPPGGEAFSSVAARIERWLGARPPGGRIVAVTHPVVIRAAVVLALGAPLVAARQIDVAPLSITQLSGCPGRWRLAGLNIPLRQSAEPTGP